MKFKQKGVNYVFLLGGVCFLRYKTLLGKGSKTEYDSGAAVFTSIGCIFLLISIITTMVNYSDQIRDVEELKKLNKYEQIYSLKSEVLAEKFANYLSEIYPQHEKDIYNKITPQEIDLYLVKYPELKASETIILLIEQIRTLQDDYYTQVLKKAEVIKTMLFRQKNPWIYYFLIPKYLEG